VLIGGSSRRMARPKHLLSLDGKLLLDRAVEALAPVVDEVVLLGAGELPASQAGRARLPDPPGTTGPLAGLGKVVSTWVLPPTLTAQYHFAPEASVRPYVGAGVNLTLFYNEDAKTSLNNAIGATKVSMKSDVGYALQAGVDIDLTDKVFLNLDVKYIDINTSAKLTTGALVNRVAIDLDPVVAGIGFGMRF